LALDQDEIFYGIDLFLDIFSGILTFWNNQFLVDLENNELISDDRLKTVQSGSPPTQPEIDSIREPLVIDCLGRRRY